MTNQSPGTESVGKKLLIGCGILIGGALLMGLAIVLWAVFIFGPQDREDRARRAAEQAAQLAARRTTVQLAGVALYKGRHFRVCARTALHNCDMTFGIENMGQASYRFERFPLINSVPSCETQGEYAGSMCADAGDILIGSPEQRRPAIDCMAQYGWIYRGGSNMSQIDPRDRQLSPGTVRIECDEGYMTGSFDDVM